MPTSFSLLTLLVRQSESLLVLLFSRAAAIRSFRPNRRPKDCGPRRVDAGADAQLVDDVAGGRMILRDCQVLREEQP
jgi:hypothetical protein